MKKQIMSLAVIGLVVFGAMISGCSKDSSTNAPSGMSNVNMNISFSRSASSGLGKTYGTEAADSIRIDSAVVVLARIKFESHLDSARYNPIDDDMMHFDSDTDYSFKGPFVIHVRDTIGINFANADLPAGTYDGIKFKIHRLMSGEQREDSDIRNHHRWFWNNDSAIAGSGITVWGSIMKNGVWTPFKYDFNGEVEFKIKGTFVVPETGSPVNIALNFNIGAFFRNTKTGALLDPTDMSMYNRNLIRQAIYAAFG
ncbi:MAG TPA: hypothetical protein VK470_10685, partial [Bacteroidota bacterium]|nr:hypothetical protein [Bacteroidota bacterium]